MGRRAVLTAGGLAALAAALGVQNLGPVAAAHADQSWGGYKNGQIPIELLTVIPWTTSQSFNPNCRLRNDAYEALAAMNTAYKGAFGRDMPINDGYRDYAAQVQAKKDYGAEAATPGTSNHGWAIAIDVGTPSHARISYSDSTYAWLKANAAQYGWVHPAWAEPDGRGPHEAWHWEYTGSYVPVKDAPAIPKAKDGTMIVIANSTTNQWVAADQGRWDAIPSGQGDLFVAISGRDRVVLNDNDFGIARGYFLGGKQTDTKVYANIATNVWYVIGPGVFYPIPSGQAGTFENAFGPHVAIDNATFQSLQAAFQR